MKIKKTKKTLNMKLCNIIKNKRVCVKSFLKNLVFEKFAKIKNKIN